MSRPSGAWRILRHNRNVPVGLTVLAVVSIVAILAPWIAPHDPVEQDLPSRLKPPAWTASGDRHYLLGSDELGRDILSRLIFGARISLVVGLGVILLSGSIGVSLGLLAGYQGGRVDTIIMRLADAQQALPGVLLAIVIAAALGAKLSNVVWVLSFTSWPVFARIVYSAVRSLKEREFVQASVVAGASLRRILLRHVLPNVTAAIIIVAALQMGRTILAEASLSFLGLGAPAPAPSWGGMVSEGRHRLLVAPWTTTYPGLAIMVTVWGINLLGDGLRQALDPRLRHLR